MLLVLLGLMLQCVLFKITGLINSQTCFLKLSWKYEVTSRFLKLNFDLEARELKCCCQNAKMRTLVVS